jgi:hypothetical protein
LVLTCNIIAAIGIVKQDGILLEGEEALGVLDSDICH